MPPIHPAPAVEALGINDVSTRALTPEPDQIPTHLPKFYLFTQKGKANDPQLVSGATRELMYGSDTFDSKSLYFNHATDISNIVNSQGNAQIIERVLPSDAGPKSNVTLWVDILPTAIVEYQRGTDNKFLLDPLTGLKIPVTPAATITGYKVKFLTTSKTVKGVNDTDATLFGQEVSGPGDQTDGTTQSTRYPLLQFWADSEGSYYNDFGLRFWSNTTDSTNGVNTSIIASRKVYPLTMSVVKRKDKNSTARPIDTLTSEQYFDFCLKQNVINPDTDAQFYLGDLYLRKYQTEATTNTPPIYADLSNFKIYQSYIDTVLAMLYTTEVTYVDANNYESDFNVSDTVAEGKYLYNLFNLVSSKNVPYWTVELNTSDVNAVRLTDGTNLLVNGGSDGTMSAANFNSLVVERISEYSDIYSPVMDVAKNVESCFYDSGFPLDVKKELCQFISIRKDLFIVLSTYEVDGTLKTLAEEISIAESLKTRLMAYPESVYYGTPVCRAIIIGDSGYKIDNSFTKRVTLTGDIAKKTARFAGASNGIWKSEYLFDKGSSNLITDYRDMRFANLAKPNRPKTWDIGVMYPANMSYRETYFPALKTIYEDPTSVLTSYFTMMACVELQKVGERVHREFTGTTRYTEAELVANVNRRVEELVSGRFAKLFTIVPDAQITSGDRERGYSWTLVIKIYANNMRTAMQLTVEARRSSDLA